MATLPWFVALILVTEATLYSANVEIDDAFPKLSDDWVRVLFEKPPAEYDWRCKVYRNRKTGDLLSFGLRTVSPKEPDDLILWSDTASEVFVIGLPSWGNSISASIDQIRANVRTFGLNAIQSSNEAPNRALEYIHVVSVPGEENRMIRGYLFLWDRRVIVLQHTSYKPTTDDVLRTVTESLRREFVTFERALDN